MLWARLYSCNRSTYGPPGLEAAQLQTMVPWPTMSSQVRQIVSLVFMGCPSQYRWISVLALLGMDVYVITISSYSLKLCRVSLTVLASEKYTRLT